MGVRAAVDNEVPAEGNLGASHHESVPRPRIIGSDARSALGRLDDFLGNARQLSDLSFTKAGE